MLILTVTLNPAVDKTIHVDDFTLDRVNRVREIRTDAGGKGINVSHAIKAMGHESTSYAIIGGRVGGFIKKTMEDEDIVFKYIEVSEETRTNLKIVDSVNQTHTDINEPGPAAHAACEDQVINLIADDIKQSDILVLSGSLLPGLSLKLYPKLIEIASSKGALVILDTEGEKLYEALNASPDIIKPNIHELSDFAKRPFETDEDVIQYIRELIETGKIKMGALVSLGEDGALWITKHRAIRVAPIKTEVKSTVGAGDSMVAALAVALHKKQSEEDMLKFATAAAIARISTDGPIQCSVDKIGEIAKQVSLKDL